MKCARVLVPQPKKAQFENITLRIGWHYFIFLCYIGDFYLSASFIRIYSNSSPCLALRRTVSIRTDLERRECMVFQRKQANSKVHTHDTSPVVWPSHRN